MSLPTPTLEAERPEGTLREDCIVNGDVSDSWVYGLLRRDWEG
ncbi:MAG: hypothetical protein ACRDT9_00575 [Agromyces sp.]